MDVYHPHASYRHPLGDRELVLAAKEHQRFRDELVETFQPLIGGLARSYAKVPGVDRRECMQAGVLGLLLGLERFDAHRGTPFWAYASWWVRRAMQQLVSELSGPIVLSDRAARQLERVKRAKGRLEQANGREPNTRDIASEAKLPAHQVDRLVAATRPARGFDQPDGNGSEFPGGLDEVLADPSAEVPYEAVPDQLAAVDVPALLEELSTREQTILRARYGFDGRERSLRELGTTLGVSAERVRQIESAALDKLAVA